MISGNTASGIPPLKWHITYLHLIKCSSIDDIEYICWYLFTFNDAHDEYLSVTAFISSEIILWAYYYIIIILLQTILLQYTIFQLKIISDLYFRMLNMNIVNYQIYKK